VLKNNSRKFKVDFQFISEPLKTNWLLDGIKVVGLWTVGMWWAEVDGAHVKWASHDVSIATNNIEIAAFCVLHKHSGV